MPISGPSLPAALRPALGRCRQVTHVGAAAEQELHAGAWADEGEQWYKVCTIFICANGTTWTQLTVYPRVSQTMLQRFQEADVDGNGETCFMSCSHVASLAYLPAFATHSSLCFGCINIHPIHTERVATCPQASLTVMSCEHCWRALRMAELPRRR